MTQFDIKFLVLNKMKFYIIHFFYIETWNEPYETCLNFVTYFKPILNKNIWMKYIRCFPDKIYCYQQ